MPEAELDALKADYEAQLAELTAARDEALAQVEAAKAEASVPEVELHAAKADHDAKIAELVAARDEALTQLRATKAELLSRGEASEIVAARDAATAELEQVKASLAGRDAAIAHLIAKHEADLAEAAASAADPWASAERHLLFFQGARATSSSSAPGLRPPPATASRFRAARVSSRASQGRLLRGRACPAHTSSLHRA